MSPTWDCFHESFMSPKPKTWKNMFLLCLTKIIQSCPDFAHAITSELSWHVYSFDMIGWLSLKLEHKQFHKILFMSLKTSGAMSRT